MFTSVRLVINVANSVFLLLAAVVVNATATMIWLLLLTVVEVTDALLLRTRMEPIAYVLYGKVNDEPVPVVHDVPLFRLYSHDVALLSLAT